MKRLAVTILVLIFLTGCSDADASLDRAMALRQNLLNAQGCSFEADVAADYGDKLYTFSMSCSVNKQGDLSFTVTAPESIAGITGTVSETGGNLTFDDALLYFPLLAEEQLSPVSAPWLLVRTLRGGYLTSACMEDSLLRLTIDDSYQEDALQADIWIQEGDRLLRGEFLHNGRKILTVDVKDYQIQ